MKKLIDAVIENDVAAVKALLEQGADPNVKLDAAGLTPLHFSAQNNAVDIAKLLWVAGANPNSPTDEGETPLDIAIQHRHQDMVQLLKLYQQQGSVH